MNTKLIESKKDYNIKELGNRLKAGEIGIFPTDTVYGIGCNAFSENSIKKLFEFKSRDFSKPINVLISDLDMLSDLVYNISATEKKLIDAFWPGSLSIVFKKKKNISDLLTANLDTIGVRMPNNSITLELIKAANIPLATTSANISGEPVNTNITSLYNNFKDKVNFIINDGPSSDKPSTVVTVVNNSVKILREGCISKEQIEKILKQ